MRVAIGVRFQNSEEEKSIFVFIRDRSRSSLQLHEHHSAARDRRFDEFVLLFRNSLMPDNIQWEVWNFYFGLDRSSEVQFETKKTGKKLLYIFSALQAPLQLALLTAVVCRA